MNENLRVAAALAAFLMSSIGASAHAAVADGSMPATEKPVIVYAGGFMGTPGEPPVYFKDHGYKVVVVTNHVIEMCDVRLFAEEIARDVERTYKKNGSKRIVFIGYSLGGLAGLYAMKYLGISDKVSTFIAVGSPFRGSNLAWLGIPSGIWTITGLQVAPFSPFFCDLHSRPLPAGPKYVSFIGTKDEVCPPWSARLEGADNIILRRGHNEFFHDKTIFPLMEAYF